MISPIYCVLLWIFPVLYYSGTSAGDIQPYLTLYTPGDLEYTDVLVKRLGDNLTLVCELKGDNTPRRYVWNYDPMDNSSEGEATYMTEPSGPTLRSLLTNPQLSLSDSGHYYCSSPPYSVSKFILVQTRGPMQCARGAFWCGNHCVLAGYVCDGFRDCLRGEDEAPALCGRRPCARTDKLNCSSGRCVSEAACCRGAGALCRQPSCCDEHPRYSRLEGYVEVEYPPLFEDRRAPDEYGFIQSTIYTVTACALIFMIAVVLLVSAICKMHMKRAALRSYTHAASHHYSHRYAQQTHRFPPCYEASRLLEQERSAGASAPAPHPTPPSAPPSPARQCDDECGVGATDCGAAAAEQAGPGLRSLFTQRYRQVPTQCCDVEMTSVGPTSPRGSPARPRPARLDHYRSPTFCDLNSELFFNPEVSSCGRELNYMSTPVEFFRRRTLRHNLDRVIDRMSRPRPLTLQLGRFQLSIPRLGRRLSLERRPDTPNIAELNINDLDFVRLNSNDTYTLNGRTIRLLGANFENYPPVDETVRPPPYTDAVRYKLYGPPPEYLSRDGINEASNTEAQARSNVEMPPGYDELAAGVDRNVDNSVAVIVTDDSHSDVPVTVDTGNVRNDVEENNGVQSNAQDNVTRNSDQNDTLPSNMIRNNATQDVISHENISAVIDTLPAIDSENANDTDVRYSVTDNVTNNVCK